MIVLVLTALGVGSAVLTPLRRRRLAELPVTDIWLVWAAFVTQIVVFEFVGYFIPVLASNVIHLLTYALCIAFMYRNRSLPGGWLIMLGTACNLSAIVANGGTMPANAEAWARAGLPEPTAFENSSFATEAHLSFLGDIFYIPAGWPLSNVFSIGDILIVLGGTYLAHVWCARSTEFNDAVEPGNDAHIATLNAHHEPIPADLHEVTRAVNDLRSAFRSELAAIASDAAASRQESVALNEEARADIRRTRATLAALLAEIEGNVERGRDDTPQSGVGRIDQLERQVLQQQQALEHALQRQRELAEMVAAVLDANSAQV